MRIGPGVTLGDLEILREIGRGAFATVYLARDTLVDRTVALKVMRLSPAIRSGQERTLMLREARLVGKLSSPNIVTLYKVHDLGEAGWAVEMEHVDGPSLEEVLADPARTSNGALPAPEALRILRGVLHALHVAHEHGIVHRDVKPGNVLLGTANQAVKITDFGLGRQIGEQSLSASSLTGFMGTPNYVSPEIIEGRPPTTSSDIWSVGVLAYRALAGSLPFVATTLPEILDLILCSEPRPLPARVHPRLAAVIRRCLRKKPGERPPSAPALLAALEDATAG